MPEEEKYTITKSTDLIKIDVCAKIMSSTDAWVTYTMDYDYWLKVFMMNVKIMFPIIIGYWGKEYGR